MRHTKIFEPIRNEVRGKPYDIMNQQHIHAKQKWDMIEKHVRFKGKRVLDVGCSEGYGAIEALELGAEFAVGIDNVLWLIEVANKAKEKLGFTDDQLQFDLVNFEDTPWEGIKALYGDMDIVLALGLIHHFKIHEYTKKVRDLCNLSSDMLVLEMWVDVGRNERSIREEARKWINVIPTDRYLKEILKEFGFRVAWRGAINPGRRELWICQRIDHG